MLNVVCKQYLTLVAIITICTIQLVTGENVIHFKAEFQ